MSDYGVMMFGELLDHDTVRMVTRQDALDGLALRRLREALPVGVSYVLQGWRDITGTVIYLTGPNDNVRHSELYSGDTIAEAAYEVQEAIGRALEGSG